MSTTVQAGIERLPRGPHRLSREQVENHQRERIIAAMIAAAGTKGYGSTTIGDITHRARVSRDTFYEQFANKEECFLAAYDATTRELLDRDGRRRNEPAELRRGHTRRRARLPQLLERARRRGTRLVARDPGGRRGGARPPRSTLERFTRLFQTVAERARAEQPGLPTVPDLVARAIVVAAVELTTQYIREDRVSSLPELEDDVLYLWLMVLAGHEVAAAAVAAKATTSKRWSRVR